MLGFSPLSSSSISSIFNGSIIVEDKPQNSGGYFPHVPRRDPEKVKRDRIRLGILPEETRQVIEQVARQTANTEFTNDKIIGLLRQELISNDIAFKPNFAPLVINERSNIIQKLAENTIERNKVAEIRKKSIKLLLLD